ncbi:hypothetical protein [Longispora albida]|uniref:hypothetical protein n=1 Tax=Longispora albida TaxID=203523 RepID=UPI00036D7BB3|nr:hypothetical protein [Longispora albida]
MNVRTKLAVLLGALALAAAGTAAPAQAAEPTSAFTVQHKHAASGALAVGAKGTIVWYNRSIDVTGLKLYVQDGECEYGWQNAAMVAFDADGNVIEKRMLFCYPQNGSTWHSLPTWSVEAGTIYGGVRRVEVCVFDNEHGQETPISWNAYNRPGLSGHGASQPCNGARPWGW